MKIIFIIMLQVSTVLANGVYLDCSQYLYRDAEQMKKLRTNLEIIREYQDFNRNFSFKYRQKNSHQSTIEQLESYKKRLQKFTTEFSYGEISKSLEEDYANDMYMRLQTVLNEVNNTEHELISSVRERMKPFEGLEIADARMKRVEAVVKKRSDLINKFYWIVDEVQSPNPEGDLLEPAMNLFERKNSAQEAGISLPSEIQKSSLHTFFEYEYDDKYLGCYEQVIYNSGKENSQPVYLKIDREKTNKYCVYNNKGVNSPRGKGYICNKTPVLENEYLSLNSNSADNRVYSKAKVTEDETVSSRKIQITKD